MVKSETERDRRSMQITKKVLPPSVLRWQIEKVNRLQRYFLPPQLWEEQTWKELTDFN